jgi:hypothetical protein
MRPVGEHELEPRGARQLAHLDHEAPVERPGHLGDDAPNLVPVACHGVCDQLRDAVNSPGRARKPCL